MSKLTQYGHAFQIKALAILITDRDFLQQIADIVSPDYFDNDAGKWIIRKTLSYYNEYKTVPTMEVFKVELENLNKELNMNGDTPKYIKKYENFKSSQIYQNAVKLVQLVKIQNHNA